MAPNITLEKNSRTLSDDTEVTTSDILSISIDKEEMDESSTIEILDHNSNRRFYSRQNKNHRFNIRMPNSSVFNDWQIQIEVKQLGDSVFRSTIPINFVSPHLEMKKIGHNDNDLENGLDNDELKGGPVQSEDVVDGDSSEADEIITGEEQAEKSIESEKVEEIEKIAVIDDIDKNKEINNIEEIGGVAKVDSEPIAQLSKGPELEQITETSKIDTMRAITIGEDNKDQGTSDYSDLQTEEAVNQNHVPNDPPLVDQLEDLSNDETAEELEDQEEFQELEMVGAQETNINQIQEPDESEKILQRQEIHDEDIVISSESNALRDEVETEDNKDVDNLEQVDKSKNESPATPVVTIISLNGLSYEEQLQVLDGIETIQQLDQVEPVILSELQKSDLEIPLVELEEINNLAYNNLKEAEILNINDILVSKPSKLLEVSQSELKDVILWLKHVLLILKNYDHHLRREYRKYRAEFLEYKRQMASIMEMKKAQDPLSVLVGVDKNGIWQLNSHGIETVGQLLKYQVVDLINLGVDPEKPLLPKLWMINAKSYLAVK